MKHALNTSIWIGNAIEARDAAWLVEQEFNVVVDLAINELPAILPRELMYLRFPIADGEDNDKSLLIAAIQSVALLLELSGLKVAVCCSAGLSRSPAITAAAIAMATSRDPEEVLTELAAQTRCDVSPALWSEVIDVCKMLRS